MRLVTYMAVLVLALMVLSCGKSDMPKTDPPKPADTPVTNKPDTTVIVNTDPVITSFSPASAKPTEEVTINGKNFGSTISAVTVTFANGTIATIKTIKPEQIVIVIPNNASSGKITVKLTNKPAVTTSTDFTFIDPNQYVVKTIGISRIYVALDASDKLTVAELFGGGNRIILKPGNDLKMEFVSNYTPLFQTASGAYPHARYPVKNVPIDNGLPPDTVGAVMLRLKGFDKSKTGYNQLNLVLCKEIQAPNKLGYYFNLSYLTIKNEKPVVFTNDFIKSYFTGDIKASLIDIAPPVTASSYITLDVAVDNGAVVDSKDNYFTSIAAGAMARFSIDFQDAKFIQPSEILNVGGPIRTELVNSEKGTMTKLAGSSAVLFSNIKSGGWDQVVEPADTTNKLFIRMSGFDPKICGFNQLRLFLTKNPLFDGRLQLLQFIEPEKPLTLDYIRRAYKIEGMPCIGLTMQ